ncbi:outer membrane receptor protein involved in Fe transport [Novosphingobium sp. 1529]|uniref:TonB-dependent receptor n=1 Tax=Novosphingobium sp. 1529 TaxID=3156424 RepID=UPI003392EE37
MSKSKFLSILLATTMGGSAAIAQSVPAQDSGASGAAETAPSGEIVVTAQRRSESVQQVPISITALGRESLDSRGVRNMQDLSRFAPGVNFSAYNTRSSSNTDIAIRGVSSTSGAGTTGVYIDDTPIQIRSLGYSGGNAYPQIFDLERVEVLRGPQGTLFGAGSEGGTIRFILPQPSMDKFSAYARGEIATTKAGGLSYEEGLSLGGPLVTDKIGFRVSISHRRDGGYVDRVNYRTGAVQDKNANRSDVIVARAALTFKPTDSLTITPAVFFQKTVKNDGDAYWVQLSDPAVGRFNSGNAIASPNRDRFTLPSLKIEADLGSVTAISSTAYLDRQQRATSDYTSLDSALFVGNPYYPDGAVSPSDYVNTQKSFTQEVRLQSNGPADSRLTWVIGGFYQHSKQIAYQNVPAAFLPSFFEAQTGLNFASIFGTGLVNGDSIYVQDPYQAIDKQLAAFGQVDFKVTPKLKIVAGLRWAHTEFNGTSTKYGPVVGSAMPLTSSGAISGNPFTPKFSLVYNFDRENNVYLTASKGFRIGGYNPRVPNTCRSDLASLGLDTNPVTFESDSVWNYELGAKNTFAGGRLRVNSSVYQIDWKNIQQTVLLPACADNFVANLGSARIRGGDIQIEARPVDHLVLSLAAAYTHAEFRNTVYASAAGANQALAVSSAGDRLPGSPWQVTASGQYDFEVAGAQSYARIDYQYQSGDPRNVAGNNPQDVSYDPAYYGLPEYHLANVRLGTRLSGIDVSVFANNVFNNNKALSLAHESRTSSLFRSVTFRPRTIGLTLSYRY